MKSLKFVRRIAPIALIAALAVGVGIGPSWQPGSSSATAGEAAASKPAGAIEREARTAVETWVETVAGGDEAAVSMLLAPEFQLVRSDGAAYDAAEYVGHDIPKIDKVIDISELVATGHGDTIVVRYAIDLKETVAAGKIEGNAPRLTVFRRDGDQWLVVAHANFAAVEK